MHISQTTFNLITSLRDCIRHDEGGGNQCANVVQEITELPGFEDAHTTAGHFVTPSGNVIDDHWWLVMGDDSILDPSQDQFGDEGFGDMVHISEKDPRYKHYFPYSGELGIPVDVLQLADHIRADKRHEHNHKTFGEMAEAFGGRPVGDPNSQSAAALPDYVTDGGQEAVPQDPHDEEFKPEEFEATLADLMDGVGDQEPYINAHRSGSIMWIDMFYVPPSQRRQGIGTNIYQKWEQALPDDVQMIKLMAANTGSGPSDNFWEAMGFEYAIQDPNEYDLAPYNYKQEMVKPLNRVKEDELRQHMMDDHGNQAEFYFEPGFPNEIKRAILTDQFTDPTVHCQDESLRWALNLERQGVLVTVVEGEYLDTEDEHEMSHTWVKVGGYIFDPTSSQFTDFPNMDLNKYIEMDEHDPQDFANLGYCTVPTNEVDHPEYMPGGDETHGYDPAYDPQAQERAPNTNTGHPKP